MVLRTSRDVSDQAFPAAPFNQNVHRLNYPHVNVNRV